MFSQSTHGSTPMPKAVADLEGGRAGSDPSPLFGRWTDAVTHGHVS